MDIEKIRLATNAVINAGDVSDGFNAFVDYMEAVGPRETLALLAEIDRLTIQRDELMADRLCQELEFLEQWLSHACNPVGQECCGRLQSGECCGSPDPVFMDGDKLTSDMAARHREVTALLNARLDLRGCAMALHKVENAVREMAADHSGDATEKATPSRLPAIGLEEC